MQNNEKIYERPESAKKRKAKKSFSIAEKNLERGHAFMASAKKSEFHTPSNLFFSIHKHPILV